MSSIVIFRNDDLPDILKPAYLQTASIGYTRDDGDFRILATMSNMDEEFMPDVFDGLVAQVKANFEIALGDFGNDTIKVLERQDTPDYVILED